MLYTVIWRTFLTGFIAAGAVWAMSVDAIYPSIALLIALAFVLTWCYKAIAETLDLINKAQQSMVNLMRFNKFLLLDLSESETKAAIEYGTKLGVIKEVAKNENCVEAE